MLFIKNAYIKTMAGADIENGAILIDDDHIVAVGADLTPPEGSDVIDAEGRLVTPGCVDAHCHIGLDNEAHGWEGRDYNEIVDPITPQMRAIDSINPMDEAFGNALQGGVTSACTGPGSANVVGGTFVAIKLAGKRVDKMIIKNPVAMKCALDFNEKTGAKEKMLVVSTASPYKFATSVLEAIGGEKGVEGIEAPEKLEAFSGKEIPLPLVKLHEKRIRFTKSIEKTEMAKEVLAF